MKAWAVVQPGHPLQHVEKPTPHPKGTQVLLKVVRCGVCHSDVHFWEGYFDLGGPEKVPMSALGINLPLTPGHEIVGQVVELGPEARGVKPGDLRVVYPWIGCGECEHCQAEEDNRCTGKSRALGVHADGGFSSHVMIPHPRYLVDFEGVEPGLAATFACSGITVYAAVQKLMPRPVAEPVVVIGAGGLGFSAIAMLRALGHGNIIVADVNPDREDDVLGAGASAFVPAGGENFVARLQAAAGGPPRAIVDLVNSPETAGPAIAALGRGGTIILVGLFGGAVSLPLMRMAMTELNIRGSFVGSLKDLRAVVKLAQSGALKPIPVTTKPMSCASEVLENLRGGRVRGRVVLEAEP